MVMSHLLVESSRSLQKILISKYNFLTILLGAFRKKKTTNLFIQNVVVLFQLFVFLMQLYFQFHLHQIYCHLSQ